MSTSSPDGPGAGTAEQLFHELVGLPPGEREAYLARVCPANHEAALRAEVLELLQGHEEAGGFLPYETVTGPLFRRPADLLPESPGDQIGPYKLMEQIGEGGFGVVWVAEQEKPVRRRVALKVLKPGMDTKQVVARFEQERQALALMDHPNIARVLDAGATPHGRPFFVMELVKGLKITEYCDQAQLPTGDRLRLFIAVCQAVQHAHQKGIIHRDIKPSNILVTLHDGVPVPKVIDFGVAKATQQQRLTDLTLYTQFEQMVGTPLYMSPEQAEMSGLDIDTRSDIYSLGVLLYELLTGRTPFDPATLMKRGLEEIRRAVREQEPQKPSTFVSTLALDLRTDLARHHQTDSARLVGQIRGDLDWIVMKALEKDRNRRYETATGFALDIQRHLGSEPVQARPPSTGYRFRRFAKRNKVAFTAGAAIAAALLAGTVVSVWQASRANAALAELRTSAPAFAEQARALAAQEKFDEAIEKLDFAIKLRPDVGDYVLAKADLLQSQLRFSEAAPFYVAALRLSPGSARAQANLDLCRSLAVEAADQPKLSRESLALLFESMRKDGRPPAQMMQVSLLVGEEKRVLLDYWMERLKDLPTPPDYPLESLLRVTESGRLRLSLRETTIDDISLLRGMPLQMLTLKGPDISDLSPLEGMPLETLYIGRVDLGGGRCYLPCGIRDLSPLRGMPLKDLNLRYTPVTDLSPLRGMPLERLQLDNISVLDFSPLYGMPLQELHLSDTSIRDLSPLRGMPLRVLDCDGIPVLDFSPLEDSPLEVLSLPNTQVEDLSFLRKMPLKTLYLHQCEKARGFKVLAEIESLEVLTLPDFSLPTFPLEELKAIAELRSHPRLHQIQLGAGRGGSKNSVTLKADFWEEFDDLLRTLEVLAQVPGGKPIFKSLPDRTWSVSFSGQKVNDLSPLASSRISELILAGTPITSLTALKDMPLKNLDLGNTRISDLEALKGHRLTDLYLNDCQQEIDLSPLAGMTSLETLALPPNPLNLDVIRKLPKLKYISFNYMPERKAPRRYWQTADRFWNDLPVETLARAGKFGEAEALLRKQAGSSGPTDWVSLGPVVLAQGDITKFRSLCGDMMSLKKEISDVAIPRSALISPGHGIAGVELSGIMENIRALKPHPGDTAASISMGMIEYRAGRYAEAVEMLTPVAFDVLPGRAAVAQVLRSMAFHRKGEFEASQLDLTKARESISRNWPRRTTTGYWQDWLVAHLLLQEADMLVADPGSRTPTGSR